MVSSQKTRMVVVASLGVVVVVVSCLLLPVCRAHPTLLFEREQRLLGRIEPAVEEKTWLFAVDGLKVPFAFVNEDGALEGFDVDVIKEVCEIANKSCQMVLAEFTECTFTHRNINMPGRGLMAGWFDVCPGYAITVDRQAAFDFSDPYLSTVSTFTVAPGNPYGFDPKQDDYSNFTLTHLTGAPTGASCLRRLKKKFGKIVIVRDLPEGKAVILNNTAQALFSPRERIEGLEVLGDKVHCDLGGAGMMTKRGSPFPAWWNPAFRAFYASGRYNDLCDDLIQKSFQVSASSQAIPALMS